MSDLDHIINQARAREDATTAALDQIPVPAGGWDIPAGFRRPDQCMPPPQCSPWRELLVLWPAWERLVAQLSRDHAIVAEPQSIYGMCIAAGRDRMASLLFAYKCGDTLAEAEQVLEELLDMACEGRRPRTGLELGLRPEMFGGSDGRG